MKLAIDNETVLMIICRLYLDGNEDRGISRKINTATLIDHHLDICIYIM